MKKLMFVLTMLSLLAGSCLAYSVSGTVYDGITMQPATSGSITLTNMSTGAFITSPLGANGSFSIGWATQDNIGDRMLLNASSSPGNQKGMATWKAMSNAERKDVTTYPLLVGGSHVIVLPEPVHHVGSPGLNPVIVPIQLKAPGVGGLQVQNAQVVLGFNNAIQSVADVVPTAPGADVAWSVPAPGQLEVNIEILGPPLGVPDFPAESFFDVMFEVEIPESGAAPGLITIEEASFDEDGDMMWDFSGTDGYSQLLLGEDEAPSPHFLIDNEIEWNEGLIMVWPESRIVPMSPAEWEHPEWGYMKQWEDFGIGEPYPPNTFLPPKLYVYPGDDDEGQPDPDDAGLVMGWGEEDTPPGNHSSAWVYDYGDPDLSNCIITVTATPPSASAISNISLGMQDVNGAIRSWHWTCGPTGVIPWDVPTTITIDTTQSGMTAANPPASGYANNPAFDLTKVQSFIADENSNWVGGPVPVPPAGQTAAIWNYWHNLKVTIKPPAAGTTNSKWYVKWSRPPEEIDDGLINGWDEVSNYNNQPDPIMADDWECFDDRPVTDIHWWGSFKGWTQPHLPPILPIAFRIGIWTDVPAGADGLDYSHPGQLIWENECTTAVWNFAGYDLDPRCEDSQYPCEENEACFQWAQFLNQDEWFWQEPMADGTPNIYWLSIAAVYGPNVDYADPDFYPWGWKTRPHQDPPPDDAIRITDATVWPPVVGAVWTGGTPVEFPLGVSWDLAFELTTNEPKCPGLKADLNEDCIVNLPDFAIMAEEWLKTSP